MNNIMLGVGFFWFLGFFFLIFLLCLLSSSITGFPFLFLEVFRDEAVVSVKLLRVEFHHTRTSDGWWCIISVQTFH